MVVVLVGLKTKDWKRREGHKLLLGAMVVVVVPGACQTWGGKAGKEVQEKRL